MGPEVDLGLGAVGTEAIRVALRRTWRTRWTLCLAAVRVAEVRDGASMDTAANALSADRSILSFS